MQSIDKELKIIGPIRLPLEIDQTIDYHQLYYFEYHQERWSAVLYGDIEKIQSKTDEPVPLRIESACFFGHVFHSRQCDCGYQLMEAFSKIRQKQWGLVIYGIDQDARGLGIDKHFCIYDFRQNSHLDTEDVFKELNAPLDNRSYNAVAQILDFLKIKKILLLSNNQKRIDFLENKGFEVTREPLEAPLDRFNMATMMLEKEDLAYQWSFKTHGDWLLPLQEKVNANIHQYAGSIVVDNEKIIAEWFGNEWNVAQYLCEQITVDAIKNFKTCLVYLSDFPRLDEIAVYANFGVSFIVLPFMEFPEILLSEAKKYNIKLQDWSRANRYTENRPQWILKNKTEKIHAYQRENETLKIDI